MIRLLLPIFLLHLAPLALMAQENRAFEDVYLREPLQNKDALDALIPINEVSTFSRSDKPMTVLLENGYAKYAFLNPDAWPPQSEAIEAISVNIIFSKYPRDNDFWLTDYHWLLAKRLKALFALDSSLNDKRIEFSITLQTDCYNEFEAMQLFHGIEINYRPIKEQVVEATPEEPETASAGKTPINKVNIRKIRQFMGGEKYFLDSTVYKVLQRNTDWQNASLVIDWTGSMYGHGAESILWLAEHEDQERIKTITFFNDGDKRANKRKQMGSTGGVYLSKTASVSRAIKFFKKVKRRGNGGDSPENDLEAIAKTERAFHETDHIILIADNGSCIRDYKLLKCLNRPVHIVLCGTKRGINHQYVNLAWQTGGSIHTKDLDYYDLAKTIEKDSLILQGVRFTVTEKGICIPVDRSLNSFNFCNRYYKAPRIKYRKKAVIVECDEL